MRQRAKSDTNQSIIVEALRAGGASVKESNELRLGIGRGDQHSDVDGHHLDRITTALLVDSQSV